MGRRSTAREIAIQMLYQGELGGASEEQVFATFDIEDFVAETEEEGSGKSKGRLAEARDAFDYACKLVRGTLANREDLDQLIRRHAENWRLERMPAIDRNVLRLAVYEMLHHESVPKVVILDEAIELAKKFGSENSGRFVNGLLDGVLKTTRRASAAK